MNDANALGAREHSDKQITERKGARQKLQNQGRLKVREEKGNVAAFARGGTVAHKADPKTRAFGQETQRPTQAALNKRPSQRTKWEPSKR